MPEPRVEVKIKAPETRYRLDLQRRAIAGLASRVAGHSRHAGTMGLTVSTFQTSLSLVSRSATLRDGRVCVGIEGVQAVLEIPDLTVYVAADYPRGSCEYKAVIAHENEHVRRTRALLRPFGRELKERLEQMAAMISPLIASHQTLAQQRLKDEMNAAMAEVMRRLEAEARRVNAEIDTAESYAEVSRRCSGW